MSIHYDDIYLFSSFLAGAVLFEQIFTYGLLLKIILLIF